MATDDKKTAPDFAPSRFTPRPRPPEEMQGQGAKIVKDSEAAFERGSRPLPDNRLASGGPDRDERNGGGSR